MTIQVSDHALVRFLERAGGLDVEAVRIVLAASLERAAEAARKAGHTRYTIIADDLRYVVRDDHVVTRLTENMPAERR